MRSSSSGPPIASASSTDRRLRRAAKIGAQVALLTVLAFALMLRLPQVSGFSMEPRIDTGEWVLISTLAFRFGRPARGDVVAFSHDGAVPEIFLKRVAALPGERVAIVRGVVYVNGTRLDEPYVAYADTRSFPETIVPADSYYVLGDNRAASNDSRAFGSVAAAAVIGRAVFALWPAPKIGWIR